MDLPKNMLFAFNSNLDYLKFVDNKTIELIKDFDFSLAKKMQDSFKNKKQAEILIDSKTKDFFLSNFDFENIFVGGQAGYGAQQAASFGINSFLHTNNLTSEFVAHLSFPEKIFLPSKFGFLSAKDEEFKKYNKKNFSIHFVFEDKKTTTRFIASFDPKPIFPDRVFSSFIKEKLPFISKAFIGGIHLLKSEKLVNLFEKEIKLWKKINPELKIFLELGHFQNNLLIPKIKKNIFPLVNVIGLNDRELGLFRSSLKNISEEVEAVLFHSPKVQKVFPKEKENRQALILAKKAAYFRAKTSKFSALSDLRNIRTYHYIQKPKFTVGLGDVFSTTYFIFS